MKTKRGKIKKKKKKKIKIKESLLCFSKAKI